MAKKIISILAVMALLVCSFSVAVFADDYTAEDIAADLEKEKVAKALSEIFELDYEKVLKKIEKRSSIETIVKKVDEEKADKLRQWLIDNNINTGINIDEDTKRYYPYNNLASQIIGFCGSDNQGLDGVEAKYDKEKLIKSLTIFDALSSQFPDNKSFAESKAMVLNILNSRL